MSGAYYRPRGLRVMLILYRLVKYFSPMTNVCIIRVAREQHKVAWGAVTLLSTVDGQRVVPNVVHVSGAFRIVGDVFFLADDRPWLQER
jgi:RNase P/RNase MRP subunit POP5